MGGLISPEKLEENEDVHEILKRIIDRGNLDLPLLPESVSKLLRKCNDPDCPPLEIASGIRQDQSIATHVLRIANSPLYGVGTRIVSLQQAIARLGINRIREIIMMVFCQGRSFSVAGYEAEVKASFRRSMAVAVFSQEIARSIRANVEEAFLFGLLHDIGRPVLLQAIIDVQSHCDGKFDPQQVISAVESFRIEVGSQLITLWKLPESVADAVRHQLFTDMDLATQGAMILNLAMKLTECLMDCDGDFDLAFGDPVVDLLNLYPDQLQQIANQQDAIQILTETAV